MSVSRRVYKLIENPKTIIFKRICCIVLILHLVFYYLAGLCRYYLGSSSRGLKRERVTQRKGSIHLKEEIPG